MGRQTKTYMDKAKRNTGFKFDVPQCSMCLCFYVSMCLIAPPSWAQIQESNLRRHITVLANDSLMGRGTGSTGERMAAAYIESQIRQINLEPMGDPDPDTHRDKTFFQSFPYQSGVHGSGKEGIAHNVIGFINNRAESTIIIGAHYDHLGLGYDGGSLDANPQDKIHNGADDNASGVAGVIELARYFQKTRPGRRTTLFSSSSAEKNWGFSDQNILLCIPPLIPPISTT